MLVPIWKGRVTDDGRLVLEPTEARLRSRYLSSLAGKEVELVLRRARKNPTVEQERYLRGFVLPVLMEHFGYLTAEELVRDLMGYHYGWHPGTNAAPLRSYDGLSQAEKSEFIEWVKNWAAVEHGVDIPDPSRAASV